MKILDQISSEIQSLEAVRDLGSITSQDQETLDVLNLCYDLLTRTSGAQSEIVETPELLKEPGFDDATMPAYGITSNPVADFAFALATRTGTISLRAIMQSFFSNRGTTQRKASAATGVAESTISEYLNGKSGMLISSYEKITNYVLQK